MRKKASIGDGAGQTGVLSIPGGEHSYVGIDIGTDRLISRKTESKCLKS